MFSGANFIQDPLQVSLEANSSKGTIFCVGGSLYKSKKKREAPRSLFITFVNWAVWPDWLILESSWEQGTLQK